MQRRRVCDPSPLGSGVPDPDTGRRGEVGLPPRSFNPDRGFARKPAGCTSAGSPLQVIVALYRQRGSTAQGELGVCGLSALGPQDWGGPASIHSPYRPDGVCLVRHSARAFSSPRGSRELNPEP